MQRTPTPVISSSLATAWEVRSALQGQGFGLLTEIDVQATFAREAGQCMEDYLILGACNPSLAHQASTIEREIGLLLPCNIVVRADGDGTLVQAIDPQTMVSVSGRDDLERVAHEAAARLRDALGTLAT